MGCRKMGCRKLGWLTLLFLVAFLILLGRIIPERDYSQMSLAQIANSAVTGDVTMIEDNGTAIQLEFMWSSMRTVTVEALHIDAHEFICRYKESGRPTRRFRYAPYIEIVDAFGETSRVMGMEFTLSQDDWEAINCSSGNIPRFDVIGGGYFLHPAFD